MPGDGKKWEGWRTTRVSRRQRQIPSAPYDLRLREAECPVKVAS